MNSVEEEEIESPDHRVSGPSVFVFDCCLSVMQGKKKDKLISKVTDHRVRDIAQLVECWPSMQKALGVIPAPYKTECGGTCRKLARERWRQLDQKFKLILCLVVSWRLAWG